MCPDAVEQLRSRPALGVAEALDQPQLLRLLGSVEERLRMLHREVVVPITVHQQQGDGADPRDNVDRCLGQHRPARRRHSRPQHPARQQPPDACLDGPVQPPHRRGAAIEPAAHRGDRDNSVDPADQRRVAQHDRPTHRPAAGDDLAVSPLAQRLHGRLEVGDLAVAERRMAAGAAVAPEIEREHTGVSSEGNAHIADVRLVDRAREAVRDDDADATVERLVCARGGVMPRREPFPVGGEQRQLLGTDEGFRCGHSAILAGIPRPGSVAQPNLCFRKVPVATLLLLTNSSGSSVDVLPTLGLLGHTVRLLPLEAAVLVDAPPADVVILDARRDLIAAKATCRVLRTTGASAPLLAVVTEGGLAAIAADWGLDDVMLDTAGPAEVEARIRLALGRAAAQQAPANEEIRSGDLAIDEATYQARVGTKPLDLTFKEFELLKYLAQHPGRVFTRAQLLQEVWGYDYFGGTRTVDVHVRRLRAKLGPEREALIGTVRNVGYKFVAQAVSALPHDELPADEIATLTHTAELTAP